MNRQTEQERQDALARIVAAARTAELERVRRNADYMAAMSAYRQDIRHNERVLLASDRVLCEQRAKDCGR